jgi:hypothetical protein
VRLRHLDKSFLTLQETPNQLGAVRGTGYTLPPAPTELSTGRQGNRVKKLCGDEACEEVVIPGGDFAAESEGIFPRALRIRLRAMCLMVVKLAGA